MGKIPRIACDIRSPWLWHPEHPEHPEHPGHPEHLEPLENRQSQEGRDPGVEKWRWEGGRGGEEIERKGGGGKWNQG